MLARAPTSIEDHNVPRRHGEAVFGTVLALLRPRSFSDISLRMPRRQSWSQADLEEEVCRAAERKEEHPSIVVVNVRTER